jgi:hypothetical protein
MFYPFSRKEIEPYSYEDGELNELILESNLMVERPYDTTLPDFWRMSTHGKMVLCRAYREDRPAQGDREPGKCFSPTQLARELTELFLHAHALAQNVPEAQTVAFQLEWVGLKDRRIWDREADQRIERKSRTDGKAIILNDVPLADLPSHWPVLVAKTATQVVQLFDFKLELTEEWVRSISGKFRQL